MRSSSNVKSNTGHCSPSTLPDNPHRHQARGFLTLRYPQHHSSAWRRHNALDQRGRLQGSLCRFVCIAEFEMSIGSRESYARIIFSRHSISRGASFPDHPLPIIRCRSIALEEGPTTMKRYQKFMSPIILGLFIWAVGMRYCAVTEECAKPWSEVIEIQPLYWLIVFGCYALAKIGLGLVAFKDCSGDAIGLDKDIKAAREDLTKRGFQFS